MNLPTCLVTGATGLLGSHLLLALVKRGYRVRALFRNSEKRNFVRRIFSYENDNEETLFQRVEWINADLTHFSTLTSLCAGADIVFHVAGKVSFMPDQRSALFLHNSQVTAALAEAALQSGVDHFVYVSSVAAIDAPQGVKMTESMGWNGNARHSDYAESKYAAEQAVWSAASRGLKVLIVNPSVVLGPGFWDSGSGSFFSVLYKGLPAYPPGTVGIVDVRDVAEAMIALSLTECFGRRFILSATDISYKELFRQISLSLGVTPPTFALQPWMGSLGILAGKGYKLLIGKEMKFSPDMIRSSFRTSTYDGSGVLSATHFRYTSAETFIPQFGSFFLSDVAKSPS